MNFKEKIKDKHFYCIGTSYKKADASVRGLFSIDTIGQKKMLLKAKEEAVDGLVVISTCNRTEIYAFAQTPDEIVENLCRFSRATADDFEKYGYVYCGKEAVEHVFNVGCGLDSQILGDFEIIGQLKKSFALSKEYGLLNSYMDRLQNAVIQASKRIKNETELSSGVTSVAFASVKYILENVENISEKKILLFGIGKIGRNTCENLVKHIDNKNITLINRTNEKAKDIGGKFNLRVKQYDELEKEIQKSDILIVATGAQHTTVKKNMVPKEKEMLILDLSVPENVEKEIGDRQKITLIDIDSLSKMTDDTLEKRKEFIPKAQEIIEEIKEEFYKWVSNRQFAPAIHMLKDRLEKIRDVEILFHKKKIDEFQEEQIRVYSDRFIQKITTLYMNHLKKTDMVDENLLMIEEIFGENN